MGGTLSSSVVAESLLGSSIGFSSALLEFVSSTIGWEVESYSAASKSTSASVALSSVVS
jgi:hypothetical protein